MGIIQLSRESTERFAKYVACLPDKANTESDAPMRFPRRMFGLSTAVSVALHRKMMRLIANSVNTSFVVNALLSVAAPAEKVDIICTMPTRPTVLKVRIHDSCASVTRHDANTVKQRFNRNRYCNATVMSVNCAFGYGVPVIWMVLSFCNALELKVLSFLYYYAELNVMGSWKLCCCTNRVTFSAQLTTAMKLDPSLPHLFPLHIRFTSRNHHQMTRGGDPLCRPPITTTTIQNTSRALIPSLQH
jgi:hypothetical protein